MEIPKNSSGLDIYEQLIYLSQQNDWPPIYIAKSTGNL